MTPKIARLIDWTDTAADHKYVANVYFIALVRTSENLDILEMTQSSCRASQNVFCELLQASKEHP